MHDAQKHCFGTLRTNIPALPEEKLNGASNKTAFQKTMISQFAGGMLNVCFCVSFDVAFFEGIGFGRSTN